MIFKKDDVEKESKQCRTKKGVVGQNNGGL